MISGYPAIENRDWLKSSAVFRRLPELKKAVADLQRRLAESGTAPQALAASRNRAALEEAGEVLEAEGSGQSPARDPRAAPAYWLTIPRNAASSGLRLHATTSTDQPLARAAQRQVVAGGPDAGSSSRGSWDPGTRISAADPIRPTLSMASQKRWRSQSLCSDRFRSWRACASVMSSGYTRQTASLPRSCHNSRCSAIHSAAQRIVRAFSAAEETDRRVTRAAGRRCGARARPRPASARTRWIMRRKKPGRGFAVGGISGSSGSSQ